jgi:hypothetical protein
MKPGSTIILHMFFQNCRHDVVRFLARKKPAVSKKNFRSNTILVHSVATAVAGTMIRLVYNR